MEFFFSFLPGRKSKLSTSNKLLTYQNNTETNLDVRNTTLGHGFHFQHKNSRTFPIESFAYYCGRTLVRAKYDYLKDLQTSTDKDEIRRYSSQYSASLSAHPKDNSQPSGATRQLAIAKTPAKWSAYQIPSVFDVRFYAIC
jgi:hypothetical protein